MQYPLPRMFGNPWFYIALLAIFFIGVAKSGFGSGVGLIIVPMTALAMGHGAFPGRNEQAALGLLLPLLIVGDLIALWQHRAHFTLPRQPSSMPQKDQPGASRIMRLLMPSTIAGVLLGSLLLWWFHKQEAIVSSLMRIEIGVESVLLVGLHWWRQSRGVQTRLVPEPARSMSTGIFAGASSTLAHAAGPIIAMYLLPLGLERRLFVATCALYFFVLNSIKLPSYYMAGQFQHAEISFTATFLPVVIAGALFGFWINKRMSDRFFTKAIYAATFVLGWYILIDGVISLMRTIR